MHVPSLPTVTVQLLIHVEDLDAAISFYQAFGAATVSSNADGDFALLALGGAQLSLLAHPPNPDDDTGDVELTLATETLDEVIAHCAATGITVSAATDTVFGRQAKVTTPDGHLLKINELRHHDDE